MAFRLPDYYSVLHVDPAAPLAIIRASYRTLMQQLRAHPDLGGDHEAAAALNAAYAVLKDPARRAQYDAQRVAGKSQSCEPAQASKPAPRRAAPQKPTAAGAAPRGDTYGSTGVWDSVPRMPTKTDICVFCGVTAARTEHGDSGDDCRVCEAPLTIARTVSRSSSETQRSVYRIAKTELVRIFPDPLDRSGFDAAVHDISLTGMRFSCAQQMEPEALVRIDSHFCAAVARIAHVSRESGADSHYGTEFLTIRFKRQRGSLLSVPV